MKDETELGLRPVRAGAESRVVKAWCKLCEAFGREVTEIDATSEFMRLLHQPARKKTKNVMVFTAFRRDNIAKHPTEQHTLRSGLCLVTSRTI